MSAGQLGERLLEEVEQGTFDEVRYQFIPLQSSAPLIALSPPRQHFLHILTKAFTAVIGDQSMCSRIS